MTRWRLGKNKPAEKGQILILIVVAFTLLGIFVGLTIDLGRGYLMKARLYRVVDAVSIAAAKALKGQVAFEPDAIKAAQDAAVMNGFTCCSASTPLVVSFVNKPVPGGPEMRFVQVTATTSIPTTFMRLASLVTSGDFSKLDVSAFAEAGPERPVDVALVLDRSGSMREDDPSGTSKINALKCSLTGFGCSGTGFLGQTFSVDDQVGMTSFGFRGCGNSSGTDASVDDCSDNADQPLGTDITTISASVDGLQAPSGTYTNTMEALLTAKDMMQDAVNDPARARTRKAVLLVTDGQPTALRRFSVSACQQEPDGSPLSAPGGGNGGITDPDGCIHRLNITGFGSNGIRRHDLSAPYTSGNVGPIGGNQLYVDLAADARTKARDEADGIKGLDVDGDGVGDVVIFAIAIGDDKLSLRPDSRLDANAKCLLALIANDPGTVFNCANVTTTNDGDTHPDLSPCQSDPTSCIDATQQQGKVFTVDLTGDVTAQLQAIFNEIAISLKLRLTA
ncbi:MAG: VWA domain-containing protein [Candidatus Binatia bacterium]